MSSDCTSAAAKNGENVYINSNHFVCNAMTDISLNGSGIYHNETIVKKNTLLQSPDLSPSLEQWSKNMEVCSSATPSTPTSHMKLDMKDNFYPYKVLSLEEAVTMYPKFQRQCSEVFWDIEDEKDKLVDLPEDLSSVFDLY